MEPLRDEGFQEKIMAGGTTEQERPIEPKDFDAALAQVLS
jgi:hypothetical protein